MTAARFHIALPLLSSLALSACLSVDVVPQSDDEPGDGNQQPIDDASAGDDAGDDGSVEPGDGDDAGLEPDASTPVRESCEPPHTEILQGRAFVTTAPICDSYEQVCIDGFCEPTPACAPGVTTACLFDVQGSSGRVVDFDAAGDYVYWLEEGTFDARENPNDDGVLARARVGTWQREVVATGFKGATAWFDLFGNAAVVNAAQPYVISDLTPPAVLRPEPRQSYWLWHCQDGSTQYWRDSESKTLYRRDLAQADLAQAEVVATNVANFGSCAVLGDKIYWFREWNELREQDLNEASERRLLSQLGDIPNSLWAQGGALYGITHQDWLVRARPSEEDSVEWERVAGGINNGGFSFLGDHAYWISYNGRDPWNGLTGKVLRSRLDGVGEQELVAYTQPLSPLHVVNGGVLTASTTATGARIHYMPMPKP